MGVKGKVEACGRCAMTSVVDAVDDDEGDDGGGRNPFDGESIEVSEDQLRAVSRHVLVLGTVKERLNKWATGLTYDR